MNGKATAAIAVTALVVGHMLPRALSDQPALSADKYWTDGYDAHDGQRKILSPAGQKSYNALLDDQAIADGTKVTSENSKKLPPCKGSVLDGIPSVDCDDTGKGKVVTYSNPERSMEDKLKEEAVRVADLQPHNPCLKIDNTARWILYPRCKALLTVELTGDLSSIPTTIPLDDSQIPAILSKPDPADVRFYE